MCFGSVLGWPAEVLGDFPLEFSRWHVRLCCPSCCWWGLRLFQVCMPGSTFFPLWGRASLTMGLCSGMFAEVLGLAGSVASRSCQGFEEPCAELEVRGRGAGSAVAAVLPVGLGGCALGPPALTVLVCFPGWHFCLQLRCCHKGYSKLGTSCWTLAGRTAVCYFN